MKKLEELNIALMDVLGIDYRTKIVRCFSLKSNVGELIELHVEYALPDRVKTTQTDNQKNEHNH